MGSNAVHPLRLLICAVVALAGAALLSLAADGIGVVGNALSAVWLPALGVVLLLGVVGAAVGVAADCRGHCQRLTASAQQADGLRACLGQIDGLPSLDEGKQIRITYCIVAELRGSSADRSGCESSKRVQGGEPNEFHFELLLPSG